MVEVDPVWTWVLILATWGLLPILQISYVAYRPCCSVGENFHGGASGWW